MEFWDEGITKMSDTWQTAAVAVQAFAIQEKRDNDNEKNTVTEGVLGGSAPVHITFEAFCTDEVVHKEWQMALDMEFNDIQLRLNQDEVEQDSMMPVLPTGASSARIATAHVRPTAMCSQSILA